VVVPVVFPAALPKKAGVKKTGHPSAVNDRSIASVEQLARRSTSFTDSEVS
jgi:hypothetical protein